MTKTNLTILTSSFLPTIGGTEIFTEGLARGLQNRGYNTKVLVNRRTSSYLPGEIDFTDFQVVSERNVFKIIKAIFDSDLLIYSQFSLFYFPFVLLMRKKSIVIHHMSALTQTNKIPLKEKLKREICKSQVNIFVSQSLMKRVNIPGIVIRNGSPWQPSLNRETKGRDLDFLFVGRLISDKGPLDAIRAYSRFDIDYLSQAPKFIFVGSGPLREVLEEELKQTNLIENVEFVGELKPEGVRELMERTKAVVVPSTFAEPFGLVAIEALLAGAIPLVSTSGGLREATQNHCLLFDTSDIQDLGQKMKLIVGGYEIIRQEVFDKIDFSVFGMSLMIDQYSSVIDEILER
jgi:glycogen(starch) synthase